MSQTKELLQTISDRIGAHADVRKVYGDPVTAGGRTIIPVAERTYPTNRELRRGVAAGSSA